MNPFEGLTDVDIRTAIANANGAKGPSLFVPEAAFELLVRKQIERLREPGLQCIDVVYDEIQRIAQLADSTDVSRFPTLRDRMFDVVNRLLRSCVTPAQAMITNLIDVELSYINTSHPDFIGGKNAVQQMNRKLNPPPNANQGNVHGGGNAQGTRNAGGNAMSSGEVVIGSKHPSSGQTQGPNQGQAYVNASENNGGSVNSQSQPVPQSNSNSNGSDTAVNGNTRGDVVPGGGFFGLFKPLGVGGVSAGNASGTNTLPNPPSSGDSITSQNQFGYSTNTVVKLPSVSETNILRLCMLSFL